MISATMVPMSLSAATNTTVAATAAKAATIGDSASTRTIYLIVGVLVVLAVGLVTFTMVFWRRTRPVTAPARPGLAGRAVPRSTDPSGGVPDRRPTIQPRPRPVSVLDDDTAWEPGPWVSEQRQSVARPESATFDGVRTTRRPTTRPQTRPVPRPTSGRPPGEPLL